MGSTYVRFRGGGFEANDSALEVWLYLLVCEMDKMAPLPIWLQEVRDEWELQATAGFGFGVMPGLDNFITTDAKVTTVVEICCRALQNINSYGQVISSAVLNAMRTGGDQAIFTKDVPANIFIEAGNNFINLLKCALKPDERIGDCVETTIC